MRYETVITIKEGTVIIPILDNSPKQRAKMQASGFKF